MVANAEVSQWDTQCPADMLHECITMAKLRGANTLIGYQQMCPLVTCPKAMHVLPPCQEQAQMRQQEATVP